jgi:hypothetical protein
MTIALPVGASQRPADLAEITAGLSDKAVRFAELRATGLALHRAAALAGYQAKNKRNLTSIGWTLTADARVASLIAYYARNLVKSAAPAAVRVLQGIMEDPKNKPVDRTRAAGKLLDKTLPSLQHHENEGRLQHEHQHAHHIEGLSPSLADLYREAGLPVPAHALGGLPQHVTDAEFEEVSPSDADAQWSVD